MPARRTTQDPERTPKPGATGHLYQPGDIIAQKYRLVRVLGQGGMGAVWLARNTKLEIDVAIKLIRHELGSEGASDRLLQEARAAARIEHRSIVRIFDYGETELDDPFIVMEVLTGDSLREVLERKGRLPAGNAVRILLPIASVLVEAHAMGVVHRDLKPENVMLVPDKSGGVVPKLLDFGIAKFRREGEQEEEDGARFVVGTPEYMAPEQAGGIDDVDGGADVWALAVILYEAITGRVPFTGDNYAALTFAIMTAEPLPIREQMAGDDELWAILVDALAKGGSARPSMRAFGGALAQWSIARGIDSDVAGTSLAAHWMGDAKVSPFSVLPPPSNPSIDFSDLGIPRPGSMPDSVGHAYNAPTKAPPSLGEAASSSRPGRASRSAVARSAAWVLIAATVASALVIVTTRGTRSRPPPATQKAAATAAPPPSAPPPSAAPVVPVNAPPTAATPTATATEEPAPPAPSPPATISPSGKPIAKKPPRKSQLPIAKKPNF